MTSQVRATAAVTAAEKVRLGRAVAVREGREAWRGEGRWGPISTFTDSEVGICPCAEDDGCGACCCTPPPASQIQSIERTQP